MTSKKTLAVLDMICRRPGLRQVDYSKLLGMDSVELYRHKKVLAETGWIQELNKKLTPGVKVRELFE